MARHGLSHANWIDDICDAFEQAWQRGERPHIETFLVAQDFQQSTELLRELVALDLDYRRRLGEAPDLDEYAARFPEYGSTLREAFLKAQDVSTQASAATIYRIDDEAWYGREAGRFRLIDKIGQGSFGTVWRAHDPELDRIVAVKLPRPGLVTNPADEDRFLREARNAAQLTHPGIVPIYDFGRSNGRVYIVSEFVEGRTLKEALAERPMRQPREAARLLAALCDALDDAHRQGVVHRDLKPSNVILQAARPDSDRSDLEQCLPRILDFGLSLRAESEATITQDGQILGTPAYMSPEQARGEGHYADGRTDVYSLGVILYQMLTGRLPHSGSSHQLIRAIVEKDAKHVRQLESRIPKDLAVVCHKCLEKDRNHRYATAGDLSRDLRRWLDGKPIVARPTTPSEHLIRWCRRRPMVAGLLAVILALCLATAGVVAWQRQLNVEARATLARRVVDNLLTASEDRQRQLLAEVHGVLHEVEPELRSRLGGAALASKDRCLLWLALLPVEPRFSADLLEAALDGELAGIDAILLREELLTTYSDRNRGSLWKVLLKPSEQVDSRKWLRSASLLAAFSPRDERWQHVAPDLCQRLVAVEFAESQQWIAEFGPVREFLTGPLASILQADSSVLRRQIAAKALGVYLRGDASQLVPLVLDASVGEHKILVESLRASTPQSVQLLEEAVAAPHLDPDLHNDEAQSKSMANAALALLVLERPESVWPLFRGGQDPRVQAYLICWAARQGVSAIHLVERLQEEQNPHALYGLLLATTGYNLAAELNPVQLARFENWLWKSYRDHPDSGVHSAIRYVLDGRGHAPKLFSIDLELSEEGIRAGRNWYHNSLGQHMIVLRPSATGDGRTFAISATETTRREFREVLPAHSKDVLTNIGKTDQPVGNVTFLEAIEFCRALSVREGFDLDAMSVFFQGEGLHVDLERAAYRLPTDDEWELACRAGTRTERFFGTQDTPLMDRYARFDSPQDSAPVASHLPNPWGLFDVYGNVYEWTVSEWTGEGQTASGDAATYTLGRGSDRVIICRGGGYGTSASFLTSSWKVREMGSQRQLPRGFRIARTIGEP